MSLAINVLTPEQHSQARKSLTKCLYDQNESEYSKVAGWCRGEFTDAKRPMTPDDFQKLVNVFWHKPGGIQSVDEVLALARCIGNVKVGTRTERKLADMLDRKWLESLGYHQTPDSGLSIRDMRYPRTGVNIPRTDVIQKLENVLLLAEKAQRPIVVVGQPGTGKSKMVESLEQKQWGRYPDGLYKVIYLNGGGLLPHLRAWYQEVFGIPPESGMQEVEIQVGLMNRFRNKSLTLLVDDLSDFSAFSRLCDILGKAQQARLLITTTSDHLARQTSADERMLIKMPGFTDEEARQMFEMRNGKLDANDTRDFNQLCETLKFNPLALFFAFQQAQAIGLGELNQLITSTHTVIPETMQPEVFLALQVAFERMQEPLQAAFARLGALERFYAIDAMALCALWSPTAGKADLTLAQEMIRQLQAALTPFISHPQIAGAWKLHQQTHLFALSKFTILAHTDQVEAQSWHQRVKQFYALPKLPVEAPKLSNFLALSKRRRPGKKHKNWGIIFIEMLIFSRTFDWQLTTEYLPILTTREYFIANELNNSNMDTLRKFRLYLIGLPILAMLPKTFSSPLVAILILVFSLAAAGFYLTTIPTLWQLLQTTARWRLLWTEIDDRISTSGQEAGETG